MAIRAGSPVGRRVAHTVPSLGQTSTPNEAKRRALPYHRRDRGRKRAGRKHGGRPIDGLSSRAAARRLVRTPQSRARPAGRQHLDPGGSRSPLAPAPSGAPRRVASVTAGAAGGTRRCTGAEPGRPRPDRETLRTAARLTFLQPLRARTVAEERRPIGARRPSGLPARRGRSRRGATAPVPARRQGRSAPRHARSRRTGAADGRRRVSSAGSPCVRGGRARARPRPASPRSRRA